MRREFHHPRSISESPDFAKRVKQEREDMHEDALPIATAITSFLDSIYSSETILQVANELGKPAVPYSSSNHPPFLEFSVPSNESMYIVRCNDQSYFKKIKISRMVFRDEPNTRDAVLLEEALLSVHQLPNGGLYTSPRLAFAALSEPAYNFDKELERSKALLAEVRSALGIQAKSGE